MKKQLVKIIAGMLLIACGQNAQAQQNKSAVSLETDPAPFILGGYSFSVKFSPGKLNHVAVTGSVYSSRFPDKMMDKSNYEKGFRDLKIETSYALFADYFIRPDRTGFHAGPSAFWYSKSVGTNRDAGRINFRSIYPNARIGYVYRPFKKAGLYVDPWVNFGKEFVMKGNKTTDGVEYTTNRFSYILAIHIGYQFRFGS